MSILGSGNVGIGTTNPFEKLQANGNIYAENRIISADATNANQNLLAQTDIKISNQNGIYGNLTKEKIPNYKHQNTNKSQIPIFNDQNIVQLIRFLVFIESLGFRILVLVICLLFVICYLRFFHKEKKIGLKL